MDNIEQFQYSVRQCGCVASRILRDGTMGRVSAVFDRSFYVELEDGLACVGTGALDASPLNLCTSAPENIDWRASGLRQNSRVSIFSGWLRVGERFHFCLRDAANWAPDQVFGPIEVAKIRSGLTQFRNTCTGRIPGEGLGCFISRDNICVGEDSIRKLAKESIDSLHAWSVESIRDRSHSHSLDIQALNALIGMGPGLTPSGDDFIGGLMIVLHRLGEKKTCRQLWDATRGYALAIGSPITRAHLSAASEGLGSAGLHRAMDAVIEADLETIPAVLADIDRIGHTSGWDAIAGVIVGLDGWLQAHNH